MRPALFADNSIKDASAPASRQHSVTVPSRIDPAPSYSEQSLKQIHFLLDSAIQAETGLGPLLYFSF